jgi:hypothetical protein
MKRGWDLQELLKPSSVELFSHEGDRLGDKNSLEPELETITGVPAQALQGSLEQLSTFERFSWAEMRETTKDEDPAYCLLGIFGVSMSLIYGKGKEKAFERLRGKIDKISIEAKYVRALRTTAYEKFKDHNADRTDGTYELFLQHEHFLA